jgi:hypothetical protein
MTQPNATRTIIDTHRHIFGPKLLRKFIENIGFDDAKPVAPAGPVVEIAEPDLLTVNEAAEPLKATLVAPLRFVPRIVIVAPTLPNEGCAFTNGPRPVDKRKIVPA